MSLRTLVFIPTYEEAENAPRMLAELLALGLDADLLFVDDASPDGTGQLLDALAKTTPRLIVQHRAGKLGIGSAHQDGLAWAYEQGYERLVTMDCDFTHSPADVPRLLAESEAHDLVVGSRFLAPGSLPGWNPYRRALTHLGHALTTTALGLPHDASGAFRVYRLDRIPRALFSLVQSRGYAFFLESLFVLSKNGVRVAEVPIVLPARTYGHSKMDWTEATRSARYALELAGRYALDPTPFHLAAPIEGLDEARTDPQGWQAYWSAKDDVAHAGYDAIASAYRRLVLRPILEQTLQRHVPAGASILHAGCGSGQLDGGLHERFRVTALDLAPAALRRYARQNPPARVVHGDLFDLPFEDGTFDGAFNLGVIEHFEPAEIERLLRSLRRVLKPGAPLVLFWPHRRATSVAVLKAASFGLGKLGWQRAPFHPPEVSLLGSEEEARTHLERAGFRFERYAFGPRDGFIQAIVVGIAA